MCVCYSSSSSSSIHVLAILFFFATDVLRSEGSSSGKPRVEGNMYSESSRELDFSHTMWLCSVVPLLTFVLSAFRFDACVRVRACMFSPLTLSTTMFACLPFHSFSECDDHSHPVCSHRTTNTHPKSHLKTALFRVLVAIGLCVRVSVKS